MKSSVDWRCNNFRREWIPYRGKSVTKLILLGKFILWQYWENLFVMAACGVGVFVKGEKVCGRNICVGFCTETKRQILYVCILMTWYSACKGGPYTKSIGFCNDDMFCEWSNAVLSQLWFCLQSNMDSIFNHWANVGLISLHESSYIWGTERSQDVICSHTDCSIFCLHGFST